MVDKNRVMEAAQQDKDNQPATEPHTSELTASKKGRGSGGSLLSTLIHVLKVKFPCHIQMKEIQISLSI